MLTRSQTRAASPAYLDIEARQPVHVQLPYTDLPWSDSPQTATVPTAYTAPLATDSTDRQPHTITQPTLPNTDDTYTTQPATAMHTHESPPAMHMYRQQPYIQTPTLQGTHTISSYLKQLQHLAALILMLCSSTNSSLSLMSWLTALHRTIMS